jgi:hypothetical protein
LIGTCPDQVDHLTNDGGYYFFNNVNNELCVFLYERRDAYGPFRVYVVVQEIAQQDPNFMEGWSELSGSQRARLVQKWQAMTYRTEAERPPYITRKPVFPKAGVMPKLMPLPEPGQKHPDPWEMDEEHILYFNRKEW